MVIQEALVHGRPLLVSDIGGMREKVQHGVTGYHVPAGNVLAWAERLSAIARAEPSDWDALRSDVERPITCMGCAAAHLPLLG